MEEGHRKEREGVSGEGVQKEIPNLSLFPSSDQLVLPMGKSQPEAEEKGLLGAAHIP